MASASQRTTDSMVEFTRKMLHTISDAKAAPDIDDQRDLPFLVDLETSILQYLRDPLEEQGLPSGAGAPMDPMAMAQGAGLPPGDMVPAPPGPGGMNPGIPTENMVSELRRSIG